MKKGEIRSEKGFTLLELGISMLILASISGIAVGAYVGFSNYGNRVSDEATIEKYNKSVDNANSSLAYGKRVIYGKKGVDWGLNDTQSDPSSLRVDTPAEAYSTLLANDYDPTDTPKESGYNFVWTGTMFVLTNKKNEVVYPSYGALGNVNYVVGSGDNDVFNYVEVSSDDGSVKVSDDSGVISGTVNPDDDSGSQDVDGYYQVDWVSNDGKTTYQTAQVPSGTTVADLEDMQKTFVIESTSTYVSLVQFDYPDDETQVITQDTTIHADENPLVKYYSDSYSDSSWFTFSLNQDRSSYTAALITSKVNVDDAAVVFPNVYDDGTHGLLPVTAVGSSSLGRDNSYRVASLYFPSNIVSVASEAFQDFKNLTKVEFAAENVEEVYSSSFLNCGNLSELRFDGNVTSIDGGAFQGAFTNGNMSGSFTVLGNLGFVGNYAFGTDSRLQDITVYGDVGKIDQGAFQGVFSANDIFGNIDIFGNVSSIGNYAFGTDSRLQSVRIRGNVGTIESGAFQSAFTNGNVVASFVVDGDIGSIGNYAFGTDSRLKTFSVGGSIGTIDSQAFQDAYTDGNIEGTFSVVGDIGSIGSSAFYGDHRLQTFTVGGSIGTIGEGAFQNAFTDNGIDGLFAVSGNIDSIGSSAFYGASQLRKITIVGDVSYVGSQAFGSMSGEIAFDGIAAPGSNWSTEWKTNYQGSDDDITWKD